MTDLENKGAADELDDQTITDGDSKVEANGGTIKGDATVEPGASEPKVSGGAKNSTVEPGASATVVKGSDVPTNKNSLKQLQTNALCKVTKCKTALVKLILNIDNLVEVKELTAKYDNLVSVYADCHDDLVNGISAEDDEAREAEEKRFNEHLATIMTFRKQIAEWISDQECNLAEQHSSASRSRSSKSSRASKHSRSSRLSMKSALAEERARLAELMVEQEQQDRELKLKAEEQRLQLSARIKKAQARERAFTMELGESTNNEVRKNNTLNPHADTFVPQSSRLQQPDSASLQSLIAALTLPHGEVPTFSGDPVEYHLFIQSFDSRIVSKTSNDADLLYFLHQYLDGDAKECISGCLLMDPKDGYREARNILANEFGEMYKVASAYVDKIMSWPIVKNGDDVGLKSFATFLKKTCYAMANISDLNILNFLPNLQSMVLKLPQYLQHKWRDNVLKLKSRNASLPNFNDFVDFVSRAAEAANDPVFGKSALNKVFPSSAALKVKGKAGSFATSLHDSSNKKSGVAKKGASGKTQSHTDSFCVPISVECCHFCHKKHGLNDCTEFAKKPMDERKLFIREKGLCFRCLETGHVAKGCTNALKCKKCEKQHPSILHIEGFSRKQAPSTVEDHTQSSACGFKTTVLHSILPVKVKVGDQAPVVTYAFYDNGSSGSFISENLMSQLKVAGEPVSLTMKTMHGSSVIQTRALHDLAVSDMNDKNDINIPKLFCRDEIPVTQEQIPKKDLLKGFPDLKQLSELIPAYIEDVEIGLLIGANCPAALQPMKVISTSGPYATLLRHGWTINGPLEVSTSNQVLCNRIMLKERQIVSENFLSDPILKIFESDFTDLKDAVSPTEKGLSQDDKRFIEIVEKGIDFKNGHFEIPLPERNPLVSLPNNKSQAIKRVQYLKHKLRSDAQYCNDYVSFMQDLIDKGYAEKAPDASAGHTGNVWYLPHHGVLHPKKKKLRVVFDCSATFNGHSLNSHLIAGPCMTSSLIGVLTRFREEQVCFMGDIEAMFYQVVVPSSQRCLLRFLWWPEGNTDGDLVEYQMTRHIFGAISSPSVCNYALREVGKLPKCSNDVANVLSQNFYVDDCLKAVASEEEAVCLISDLQSGCQEGGFRLHKFVSNRVSVLKSISKSEQAKALQSMNLDFEDLPVDRALGMEWNIENDAFQFSFGRNSNSFSRRSLLSVIASIYDPLGILSPFILPGKKLLQELCMVEGLGWDECIPEEYAVRWKGWLQDMESITKFHVQRCLVPKDFQIVSSELHVFADASKDGYGAVAYLRISDGEKFHCSILMGKSRVKPVRSVTIPRMELTAATVALQIGTKLVNEMECKPNDVIFHTDSTTVLHYLHNQRKRFPVFVANRVQLILDFSSTEQWRYVDSELNPADDASRGLSFQQTTLCDRWINGPSFLWRAKEEWPEQPDLTSKGEEIPVGSVSVEANECDIDSTLKLITHYSGWMRLKRAVAVYLKLLQTLKDKVECKKKNLKFVPDASPVWTVDSLESAENAVIRVNQNMYFEADLDALKVDGSGSVSKQSPLYRLDPFLKDGILHVGGRLKKSSFDTCEKHPILLPRKSHVTTLVIRFYHDQLKHAGRNHCLSAIRERFWIVGANAAVRSYIWNCVLCRRFRYGPGSQKMADLPSERISCEPPFTFTGLDLFGPFFVRVGRKEAKRYGIILTCLSSRAVHLEVVNSLETDAFINALRRFIARRGTVRRIRCDNGTNFVGAELELLRAIEQMEHGHVRDVLLEHNIEWLFNPPGASHMGGAWERQIRTVRKVLTGMLHEFGQRLNDESLQTLFCEAEAIVNSRPITCISDDSNDLSPLTPNHILQFKSYVGLPSPGQFQDADMYARKRWRQVQYLSDLFWSRWKKEFLLTLQGRQKWRNKQRNLSEGDIVLICDNNLPRNQWNLGRVIKTESDENGLVRSVFVRAKNSEFRRPINKLVLLLPNDST